MLDPGDWEVIEFAARSKPRLVVLVDAGSNEVVVDAGSVAEAVATRPRRKLVIKGGRIVAKDGVLVP